MYSPIVLFCYRRLSTLKLTLESLRANYLAKESELFIFSDGPKGDLDFNSVNEVRQYIQSLGGFKKVTISMSNTNLGLANSIISGVSKMLESYESVIVMEDDLVTSPNFLNYMNEALNFYSSEPSVFSITGFSVPVKSEMSYDVYFTQRSNSYGWATWRDRWADVDWDVSDYYRFKNNIVARRKFNQMGSDMSTMLDKQIRGEINSWAIRWCYHQFVKNLYSVHPFISKVQNIGFGLDASNTKERYNRFSTELDKGEKVTFNFSKDYVMRQDIINQFIKPFSITSRIKYKLISWFNKI